MISINTLHTLSKLASLFDRCLDYEAELSNVHKKRSGTVYTPPEIAFEMAERAIGSNSKIRVCDPACGAGLFLLVLAEILSLRCSSREEIDTVFSTMLFGVDTDGDAISLCRELIVEAYSLLTESAPPPSVITALNSHIIVGDALLDPLPFLSEESLHYGFDLVIGNPPYGLSRDGGYTKEMVATLKERFHGYLSGRINKYLLFMARAYELAKEGGIISLIVPNAWLGIQEAKNIRACYLLKAGLSELIIPRYKVFAARGVEPVILLAKKKTTPQTLALFEKSDAQSAWALLREIPRDKILEDSEYKISISDESRTSPLLNFASQLTLGSPESPFTPRIAIQAYAEGKGVPPQTKEVVATHPFHVTHKVDEMTFPYLEGRDIKRFSVAHSGGWLRYGEWLSEHQPLSRFSGPRIVMREVLGKTPHLIQAAYVEETMIYNKSVIHILPKEGVPSEWIWALVAILNSPLVSKFISERGNKSQRKLFPKVVLGDVKGIPLPHHFQSHVEKLAALAKERTAGYSQELEEEIERRVEEAYL